MTHCHTEALEGPVEPAEDAAPAPPAPAKGRDRWWTLVAVLAITGLVAGGAVAGYFLPVPGPERTLPEGASVFFNAACGDCHPYMDNQLMPALMEAGVQAVQELDYVNEPRYRAQLNDLSRELGIPYALRGHLMTFVKDGPRLLVLSGHVPGGVVADALANVSAPPHDRLLVKVSDGDMTVATQYFAWAFTGDWSRAYRVEEPLRTYLDTVPQSGTGEREPSEFLLPMVVVAGLVDGLNPCAFAVLLFLLALLYATRRPRVEVLGVGGIYIYAIFAVYFLIGIGLIGAIVLSGDAHLMARLGAVLLFAIGGITIANALFPAIPSPFRMSAKTWGRLKPWMQRATIPAAAVSGLLVGLCTFPCSGGIYVAVVGLIASHTAYLEGLAYLMVYNLMFVLPLVVILVVVSNRTLARGMAAWERAHQKEVRIATGVGMLLLAVLFYLWVL